jgi:error-prone DNA polymerase
MSFYREELRASGVLANDTVKRQRNGALMEAAGSVITRQRPATAKGFVFLSVEDETGIVNVIVNPDLFARQKEACVAAPYVRIRGVVQNTWNVVSLKAVDVQPVAFGAQSVPSHNFH